MPIRVALHPIAVWATDSASSPHAHDKAECVQSLTRLNWVGNEVGSMYTLEYV